MYGMEVVKCEHCGEKTNVLPSRQPVTYAERQNDAVRSFLIIGADNWLLHRCIIPQPPGQ